MVLVDLVDCGASDSRAESWPGRLVTPAHAWWTNLS